MSRDPREPKSSEAPSRRAFLRASVGASAGAAAACVSSGAPPEPVEAPAAQRQNVLGLKVDPIPRPKVAVIGTGARGQVLVRLLARLEVDVVALCDVDAQALAAGTKLVTDAGRPAPQGFGGGGDEDYLRMLDALLTADGVGVDLAIIATPWRWHVPQALAAMERGVHVGVEVPVAYTLEDCWRIVDAAERERVHCMMLENVCYGREEMMALNLCRAGLLGELTHGEGAYIHNLSAQLGSGVSEGLWRPAHHLARNGNLYPTHGLGPIAQYMGVHAGDRLATLVSMSSPARGRRAHAERALGADAPEAKLDFICGDINTSILQTALGRTIVVQHDTTTPRPYTRLNHIQGTRGTLRGFPGRIHVVDRSPEHAWEPLDAYQDEFDHPVWKRLGPEALGQAHTHGGMDFVMLARLVECLVAGEALDMSVYDGVAWSCVSPLSEQSVAQGGAPVAVPDFTRGAWRG